MSSKLTKDTLGHALATGVLTGIKGWVWCEIWNEPTRPGECNEPDSKCPGPHKSIYVHNKNKEQV